MTDQPPPPPGFGAPPPTDAWPTGYAGPPAQAAWPPGYVPYPQPGYAPGPYAANPYAAYAQPAKKHSTLAFWIVFGLVQLAMLALTVGAAASQSGDSCASDDTTCNDNAHAWLGVLLFWVIIDLCFSTYYGFRHHRR